MILHGVEAPNIIHTNTAEREPCRHTGERTVMMWFLLNPPFGGQERAEVQQKFSNQGGETAYLFYSILLKY